MRAASSLGLLLKTSKNKHVQLSVQPAPVPQQTNAYDCGVYVLAIAEILVHTFLDSDGSIQSGRKHLQDLLDSALSSIEQCVTATSVSQKELKWLPLYRN